MRSGIISLFFSNGLAFLAIGLSYIYYSKHLDAGQFGLYAIALVLGSFSMLILDGGLKTTIIKHSAELSRVEQGSITFFSFAISVTLIVIILIGYIVWVPRHSSAQMDSLFIVGFVGAYIISYPLILVPTATLERKLRYNIIGWVESASIMVERGLPAILLSMTDLGMYSFVVAVFIGRTFRVTILLLFSPVQLVWPSISNIREVVHLIREGGWYQLSVGIALIRDNLHVLLIGPFFGKQWVGYYAWALQLCMISSQVFVQIASRVSLPILTHSENPNQRWEISLRSIRLLTILTTPVLFATWLILPSIDRLIFHMRWASAIILVPYLFFRMIPGMATTPLGTLLLVEKGAKAYCWMNIYWTLVELLVAVFLIIFAGPIGLAWSYALTAFIGLWLMLYSLKINSPEKNRTILKALFYRPSFLIGIIGLAAWYFGSITSFAKMFATSIVSNLLMALFLILVSYLVESMLISELRDYGRYRL